MFSNKFSSLVARSALLKGTKPQLIQQSKRQFSGSARSAGVGLMGGLGALSLGGLTYLSYMGHKQFMAQKPTATMSLFNPTVK